jgi:hypothetical protein
VKIRIQIDIDHAQVTLEREPSHPNFDNSPTLVARQLLDVTWMDGCAWLMRQAAATAEASDERL